MTTDHKNDQKQHSILSVPHQLQDAAVCCRLEPLHLSPGWTAVINLCFVYLTVFLLFGLVFFVTLPRAETQVYNVSITSEDYRATLRLEMEPLLRPVRVHMMCQLPDRREISILYEMEERLIVYRSTSQPWCYVRTSTGAQFQEEKNVFRSLILGENAFEAQDSKPEIHLLKFSDPMSSKQWRHHLSEPVRQFCEEHQTFWLTHFDAAQDPTDFPLKRNRAKQRRRSISNVHHVDACFQTLVVYEDSL